jgi:hypothetical protein
MDVSFPYKAVVPSLDGEVLVVLARSSQPQTGRAVARLVHRGSRAGVSRALARLVEEGIVLMAEVGSAHTYLLNRDHIAVPAVEILANLRQTLLEKFRGELQGWDPLPSHVSVFGSFARRDGNTQSDIDLLIIRPRDIPENNPRWRDQLHNFSVCVQSWTGNHAGIVEIPEEELQDLEQNNIPALKEIKRDGIELFGVPLKTLLSNDN